VPMVKGLGDAEIRAIAEYLGRQQAPYAPAARVTEAQLGRGQELVVLGAWDRGLAPCVGCHGPQLEGVAPGIPGLAGQWPQYVRSQLSAYRHGRRASPAPDLMTRIAGRMSTDDVDSVSAYIASLPPGAAPEAPTPAQPEAWVPTPQSPEAFTPPPEAAIPAGPYGDLVRLGRSIFEDTPKYAGEYAHNALSCRNCHLDRGRAAQSAPMWAAYVHYPEYRKKDGLVNTLQMRIQGCFRYSHNGVVPPADGREITALVTYFHWLATGLPVGIKPDSAGYARLSAAQQQPSPERGATIYASNCALCHGEDGQGRGNGGPLPFPPLWGPQSFNWGAGMHQVDLAAAFIKRNMPYGAGGTLSDQDAWDVAAFVNRHPRPQDPRFTDSTEKTRELYHANHQGYYGREVDGEVLGTPEAGTQNR
jgi:thiosulfate dehydrogenase